MIQIHFDFHLIKKNKNVLNLHNQNHTDSLCKTAANVSERD